MQSVGANNRQLNSFVIISIGLVIICIFITGLLFSAITVKMQFQNVSIIDIASLILFVSCCCLAIPKQKTFFFLLPFILIAFPTAVNNFMPGVYLGTEYPPTIFPFITHIDIFLFLGVMKSLYLKRSFQLRSTSLLSTVVILFSLSSIVNIFTAPDSFTVSLLIAGLFPVRYLLLTVFLVSNTNVFQYEKQIVYGLMFSVFFLLLESSVYTRMFANDEGILISGSLAANTFGNIISAIMMFFIFIRRNKFRIPPFLFYPLLASCAAIILLTETRMSIFAALASFLLVQFFQNNILKSFLVVVTFSLLFFIVYINLDVPKRYSLAYLSSKIEFHGWSSDPMEMITIERTPETNSLYSRLRLYSTALNMLYENPIFGTGYGTFNYLKDSYGFRDHVLIDAHNGYLNTLAQLGLSSVFFLYFIYLYPFFNVGKANVGTFLKWLFVINITMAIADLSNAGIYKYSVFALLAFNSVVLSNLKTYNTNGRS